MAVSHLTVCFSLSFDCILRLAEHGIRKIVMPAFTEASRRQAGKIGLTSFIKTNFIRYLIYIEISGLA